MYQLNRRIKITADRYMYMYSINAYETTYTCAFEFISQTFGQHCHSNLGDTVRSFTLEKSARKREHVRFLYHSGLMSEALAIHIVDINQFQKLVK